MMVVGQSKSKKFWECQFLILYHGRPEISSAPK
jgi:hypothetical protein